jgi:hypothetical protein
MTFRSWTFGFLPDAPWRDLMGFPWDGDPPDPAGTVVTALRTTLPCERAGRSTVPIRPA